MTKVLDIVKGALGILRVQDAHDPVQNDDAALAVKRLNSMMRSLEADDYAFGWSDVEDVQDDMPTEPFADDAIMYGLAVRLRAHYGVNVDADVFAAAGQLLDSVWRKQQRETFSRPTYNSLPIGVGRCVGDPFRS